MSKLRNCLKESDFSKEDSAKIIALSDKYKESGDSEFVSYTKAIHDYHKGLVDEMNALKKELKTPIQKYEPPVLPKPKEEINVKQSKLQDNGERPKFAESEAENELAVGKLSKEDNPKLEPSVKAIESEAENKDEARLNKAEQDANKLINEATGVKTIPISELSTDENRFQNRDELDADVVKNIAENFDENQFDPIVVWKEGDKTLVLAGHHRLEGAKQAGKKNIKVRYFEGTEAKAIEFAIEKSNANRTMENPIERAKIYRDKLRKGESKKSVEEEAKRNEGKNASLYLNIAALSPNGMAIQTYNSFKNSEDVATQKEVAKILDWIGEVRRSYSELTNQHEQELFEFLFKGDAKRISDKKEFKQKITTIVGAMDFDVTKPLNIARFKHKSEGEKLYEKEIEELKQKINERQDEITDLKDRFINPKNPKHIKRGASDYEEVKQRADDKIAALNVEQKKLQSNLYELQQKKGDYVNAGSNQESLFQKKKSEAKKANIAEVIKHMKEVLPKVKIIYDENLDAAGQLKGDTILINPYYADTDTPIHEVAHVLLDAMGESKVVKAAIAQLKDTALWKETKERYPELNESQLANEVLAEAIGMEGKGIFDSEVEQNRFISYLNYIFDWLKQKLGLDKNIAKSLAKQIIAGIGTKELTGLSGSEIKNQIIGEVGAENIASAKNNLFVANEMEKSSKSAKEIYLATGWERGFDGKWRYDLIEKQDDFKMSESSLNEVLKALKENPKQSMTITLSNLFSTANVLKAYPFLKDIKIKFLQNENKTKYARYNESEKTIYIYPSGFNQGGLDGTSERLREYIRGIFVHEAQHAIQFREGFEGGGSPMSSPTKELKEKLTSDYRKKVGYFKKILLTVDEEEQKQINNVIKELENEILKIENSDLSFQAYERIAGEVEARNVTKRLKLTPEQRKNIPISETEDFLRSQQLKSTNKGVQESAAKKKYGKSFAQFREQKLGRNVAEIKSDLAEFKRMLAEEDLTPEEETTVENIIRGIQDQLQNDKEAYDEFLGNIEDVEDIADAKDLNDYTLEQLTQAWNTIRDAGEAYGKKFNEIKLKIANHINREQLKTLENNPDYKEGKKRDMKWREKWIKALADVSDKFPPIQALSNIYEAKVQEKSNEVKARKAKLEKLGRAVIKERNGKLGSVSDWFTSDSAKYFEYMEDNGKLRTDKSGLTPAQIKYLDFYTELINEKNEALNEDAVTDNIIRLDKGFQERWRTEGPMAAVLAYFKVNTEENTNYLNYNGALTSKFNKHVDKTKGYSKDFYRAGQALIEDLAHVKYMNEVVPIVDSVEYFYETLGFNEKTGYKHTLEFLQNWKDEHLYEKKAVTDPTLDAALRFLRKLTSTTTMGFNIPANVMNVFMGNYNAWRQEGLKHWTIGQTRLFGGKDRAGYGTVNKKALDIGRMFDVVNLDHDSNPKVNAGSLLADIAFAGQTWGETQIQLSQFLGYLTPEEYNSFEYNKDGELKLKDGVDKKTFDKKMNEYKQNVHNVQGKYSSKDRRNFMRFEAGKAIAQFKLWIPDFIKVRFGEKFVDRHGKTQQGSWRGLTKEALNELREDIKKEGPKAIWNNKRIMANIKGLATIVFFMTMMADDDDDDDKKRKETLSLENALSNLLFVIDPQQSKYLLSSPAAGITKVTNAIDAVQSIWDGEFEKAGKSAKKLIPGNKLLDVPKQLGMDK